MRLDLHMSPRQHREGFADRIARLLAAGEFRALRGQWRVVRKLAVHDTSGRRPLLQHVTFELEPCDAVAQDIAARQVSS